MGITFAVYGQEEGAERLIPFDIVPRVLPHEEWVRLDTGLKQRVRAYCRLAVGRDYLDAAPVRGVRQGGGGEKMEANVLVAESAQQ